jgi:ATP-dependent DNA ligase
VRDRGSHRFGCHVGRRVLSRLTGRRLTLRGQAASNAFAAFLGAINAVRLTGGHARPTRVLAWRAYLPGMLIERMRKRLAADRASFIEPCLPSPADGPPSGSNWIHEIKHDGYRLMARRDPVGIRLITRRGREPPQGAVLPDRRRGGVL